MHLRSAPQRPLQPTSSRVPHAASAHTRGTPFTASFPAIQAARGDQQGHDAFYALLYVGLWHEAHGNAAAAEAAIVQVGWGATRASAAHCRLTLALAARLTGMMPCLDSVPGATMAGKLAVPCSTSRRHAHLTTSFAFPRLALPQACRTQYAQQSGDYMAALARVHCLRRGWQA